MLLGQMVALAVYYMYFHFLVPVKQVRHQATCLADIIASSLLPRDRGNEVGFIHDSRHFCFYIIMQTRHVIS